LLQYFSEVNKKQKDRELSCAEFLMSTRMKFSSSASRHTAVSSCFKMLPSDFIVSVHIEILHVILVLPGSSNKNNNKAFIVNLKASRQDTRFKVYKENRKELP